MNREQLTAKLRESGYKATPQRLAICGEILSREDHPTAEQVYAEVSKKHPTISLTTIYHTLDLLKDLNLLHELQLENHASRFDPNTSVHVNIICQKCKKIWDFESEGILELWSRIVTEMNNEPIGQRLDVYVLCDECKI